MTGEQKKIDAYKLMDTQKTREYEVTGAQKKIYVYKLMDSQKIDEYEMTDAQKKIDVYRLMYSQKIDEYEITDAQKKTDAHTFSDASLTPPLTAAPGDPNCTARLPLVVLSSPSVQSSSDLSRPKRRPLL